MGRILTLLLLPIALVAIMLIRLAETVCDRTFARKRESAEVETYLVDFLAGEGGVYDWDNSTSIPISDPWLDAIRSRAGGVRLPLNDEGRETLQTLLAELRAGRTAC